VAGNGAAVGHGNVPFLRFCVEGCGTGSIMEKSVCGGRYWSTLEV
jgi:hypothetical protein